jgi:dTDP-4-dehydrorhamnose 3,5-epimerase
MIMDIDIRTNQEYLDFWCDNLISVTVTQLDIPGAWFFTPRQFSDDRGVFFEWFQDSTFLEAAGHSFTLAQANCSISSKGTLRGIHFAEVPPGQRKYVTCLTGSALDVLVDLRKESPTFGQWRSVQLDMVDRNVVSIPNGVGHAFMALEDNTTIVYLCDQRYNPKGEHEIYPLDPEIGIEWPSDIKPLLSPKDEVAPSMIEALKSFSF